MWIGTLRLLGAASLFVVASAISAEATPGFASAGLEALSAGNYSCSLYNGDAGKGVPITFVFQDEICNTFSDTRFIAPGGHATAGFAASLFTGSVICKVYIGVGPDGKVSRKRLTAAFSVNYGGQTSAALPLSLYLSTVPPACTP